MQESTLPVVHLCVSKLLNRARTRLLLHWTLAIPAFLCFGFQTAAQTPVLTQHNDNGRTGQNTTETILNTSNVNVNQFGKLFALPVDGKVYAQPLYVPGVTINGAVHNVLIVATENDSVYAFDADSNTGGNASPLWKASMVDAAHGATSGETPLNSATTVGCTDTQPLIGITSTPVIDATTNTVYVEAKSTNGSNYFHRLHSLNLLTGKEKTPGAVLITATVSGTGDGSSNGQLVFNAPQMALDQHNRVGLLLQNGTIFIAFASHCDNSPYHGWLFAYDEATLTQKSVYVTTPNGGLGGFWMSGSGIAADSSGNIFIASGNGSFDTTNVPATETGDTILKLGTTNQTLSVLDYFTPQDQATLNSNDTDLGSGGVLLLPNQPGTYPHLLVEAGKEGRIYVVNRDQMTTNNSHYCSGCSSDPEIVEESASAVTGGIWSMPAYWNSHIYFWGSGDLLMSIPIVNGLPNLSSTSRSTTWLGWPGATPSISSNGTTAGTGILWATDTSQYGSPGPGPGPAVLHALDATSLEELWNSTQAANNRDAAGNAVKFAVPTISNGKVYVGTSTEVDVYGEFSTAQTAPAITSANNTAFSVGIAGSFTVTATGIPTPSLSETGTLPSGVTFKDNGNGTATLSGTPAAGSTGTYSLTINAHNSVGTAVQSFTLTVKQGPAITTLSPSSGPAGTQVTITGTNFGSSGAVTFNTTTATTTSWSATSIVTLVPAGATTGNVVVTVSGVASNGMTFTVTGGGGQACPCTIWAPSVKPGDADSNEMQPVELGVKFTSTASGYITGIRFYKGVNNTGTHVGNLWSSTGALLASATFTGESSSGWQQVNFSSPVAITANTVYVASYFSPTGDFALDRNYFATSGVSNPPLQALKNGVSGSNGVYNYGSVSVFPTSSYEATNYWVDVVFNSGGSTPPPPSSVTIWPSTATPGDADSNEMQPVELGVKFTSTASGYITGIRFYKGVNNTGTHVGNLWSSTGALLASATFTGESSSGWQQVNFSSPVAITANTVYVASYFSPTGDFALDRNYFATSGVSNPPLQALKNGVSGSNGVYNYGSTSVFPTSSYEATNYWVDVVFNP